MTRGHSRPTGLGGPRFFGAHDCRRVILNDLRKESINQEGEGKTQERTNAGLIGVANSANPRYLCLLSTVRLPSPPQQQDGCTKTCSTKTFRLVGSFAPECIHQQSKVTSFGPARGLAWYLAPHIILLTTESTTTNSLGGMGSVPALCYLGPGRCSTCTSALFSDFTSADSPYRNYGPSSPHWRLCSLSIFVQLFSDVSAN